MNRKEILQSTGMKQVDTKIILDSLKEKTTKVAQRLVERIETIGVENYIIFADKERFTIYSPYMVHKYEHQQISKLVAYKGSKEYVDNMNLLEEHDLWVTWVEAKEVQ